MLLKDAVRAWLEDESSPWTLQHLTLQLMEGAREKVTWENFKEVFCFYGMCALLPQTVGQLRMKKNRIVYAHLRSPVQQFNCLRTTVLRRMYDGRNHDAEKYFVLLSLLERAHRVEVFTFIPSCCTCFVSGDALTSSTGTTLRVFVGNDVRAFGIALRHMRVLYAFFVVRHCHEHMQRVVKSWTPKRTTSLAQAQARMMALTTRHVEEVRRLHASFEEACALLRAHAHVELKT